jgi:hypothetical protein
MLYPIYMYKLPIPGSFIKNSIWYVNNICLQYINFCNSYLYKCNFKIVNHIYSCISDVIKSTNIIKVLPIYHQHIKGQLCPRNVFISFLKNVFLIFGILLQFPKNNTHLLYAWVSTADFVMLAIGIIIVNWYFCMEVKMLLC